MGKVNIVASNMNSARPPGQVTWGEELREGLNEEENGGDTSSRPPL